MNCASVENVLDLYAEERLTPARASAVEAHLKSCRRCQTVAEEARRPLLKRSRIQLEGFQDRLRQALSRGLEKPAAAGAEPPPLWRPSGESVPVLAGAALCACLGLLLHWLGPGVPSQGLPSQAQQETLP